MKAQMPLFRRHFTAVTFGAWEGHRKAVCWTCNWVGPSHSSRRLAEEEAREHEAAV